MEKVLVMSGIECDMYEGSSILRNIIIPAYNFNKHHVLIQ